MGTFSVRVQIRNPEAPQKGREVDLVVDTGATLTTIPRPLLTEMGLQARFSVEAVTIEGRSIRLEVGIATIAIDGRQADVPVAFGLEEAPQVLGATSLELLGFQVDPIRKTLIPRPLLAL